MSSDKNFGAVTPADTTALTATYGSNSAGWTTPGIDVSGMDFLQLELSYTHKDSGTPAASLSLQPMFGERTETDLDNYSPELEDPTASGALTDLAKTVDVSGLSDDDVLRRVLRIDTRGASMLRLAAKVDDATDSPTLTCRYLGGGRATPLATSPDVE